LAQKSRKKLSFEQKNFWKKYPDRIFSLLVPLFSEEIVFIAFLEEYKKSKLASGPKKNSVSTKTQLRTLPKNRQKSTFLTNFGPKTILKSVFARLVVTYHANWSILRIFSKNHRF